MAVTKLWTIGYERVGMPDFVAALKKAKIKTLIDVREVANSRRAGFSKRALAASLDAAGIAYIHLKPLGTPKAGREAARKGDTKTMTRIFEAKLAEPEAQQRSSRRKRASASCAWSTIGANAIAPLSPIASAGTLAWNRRTSSPDRLNSGDDQKRDPIDRESACEDARADEPDVGCGDQGQRRERDHA